MTTFQIIFQTLLELGASPNYRDVRGLTPLYYTVFNDTSPYCLELLLHDHAVIGIKDEHGWTEVHQVSILWISTNAMFCLPPTQPYFSRLFGSNNTMGTIWLDEKFQETSLDHGRGCYIGEQGWLQALHNQKEQGVLTVGLLQRKLEGRGMELSTIRVVGLHQEYLCGGGAEQQGVPAEKAGR
jgi:hypothetical protein